jgi:hypothetical protein
MKRSQFVVNPFWKVGAIKAEHSYVTVERRNDLVPMVYTLNG